MNESPAELPPSTDSEPAPERQRFFHFWRCFWLTFLVVSLAYAWYCFYVPANDIAWADGYSLAQQQAADAGKPMILYFTGQWCVPCRVMKRQVWADEEVKSVVNEQFVPVAIDVGSPDNAELLTRYNIGGTPVTIVTDSQGNALRWRVGGIGKVEFLDLLAGRDSSAAEEE
ncbi:thioredoxin family protein [Aeoliella sp.]|uniref:thioredoxin family protein n=1 Tax=Aeoliella sp. TaxID=2795800 RepID=UPI003CCBB256